MNLTIIDKFFAWLATSDLRAAHKRLGKMASRGVGTSFALKDQHGITIYTSYPREVSELDKFIDTMGASEGE